MSDDLEAHCFGGGLDLPGRLERLVDCEGADDGVGFSAISVTWIIRERPGENSRGFGGEVSSVQSVQLLEEVCSSDGGDEIGIKVRDFKEPGGGGSPVK